MPKINVKVIVLDYLKNKNMSEEYNFALNSTRILIIEFKQLLVKVRTSFGYIALLSLFLSGVTIALTLYKDKLEYEADLSFMVSETGASRAGVSAVLSQFGLGSGAENVNLAKIAYLSRSESIIYDIMLDSVDIEGENLLLAEHIVKRKLVESLDESNVYFTDDFFIRAKEVEYTDIDKSFSIGDKIILNRCYRLLAGSKPNTGYVSLFYNDINGVIDIVVNSPIEEMSSWLAISVYNKLQSYFTNEVVDQKRKTTKLLKEKKDSLESVVASLNYQIGKVNDQSLNFVLAENRSKLNDLNTKLQIASVAYGEVVRNYETSLFVLNTSIPTFQLVEYPILPLKKITDSYLKNGIISFLLVFIISIVLVFLYHSYSRLSKA